MLWKSSSRLDFRYCLKETSFHFVGIKFQLNFSYSYQSLEKQSSSCFCLLLHRWTCYKIAEMWIFLFSFQRRESLNILTPFNVLFSSRFKTLSMKFSSRLLVSAGAAKFVIQNLVDFVQIDSILKQICKTCVSFSIALKDSLSQTSIIQFLHKCREIHSSYC